MKIRPYKTTTKEDRQYWNNKDGEGRIWWESLPAKHRFDIDIGLEHKGTKTKFCPQLCWFGDLELVFWDEQFDFLNKIKCQQGYSYIYCVIDNRYNIIKIGQSVQPMKRIKQHMYNFQAYGRAQPSDLSAFFTRIPIPDGQDSEEKVLKHFRQTKKQKFQLVGREYFLLNEHELEKKRLVSIIKLFLKEQINDTTRTKTTTRTA